MRKCSLCHLEGQNTISLLKESSIPKSAISKQLLTALQAVFPYTFNSKPQILLSSQGLVALSLNLLTTLLVFYKA